jgi:hypothetical protein
MLTHINNEDSCFLMIVSKSFIEGLLKISVCSEFMYWLRHGKDCFSGPYPSCRRSFLLNYKLLSKSWKSSRQCHKYFNHWRSCRNFFINLILKNKENENKLREDHYNKIVGILGKWTAYKPKTLEIVTDTSLGELYLDIMQNLQSLSENRYNQIRKHLENDTYREENSVFINLEEKERKYNTAFKSFIEKTNKDIETGIKSVNPFLYLCEEDGSKQNSCYNRTAIIEYFLREFRKYNMTLDIDVDGWLKSTNGIPIAKGDSETLKGIRTTMTEILPLVINGIYSLLEERKNIVCLYNDDVLPKLRNLMTCIEDNHQFNGECGLYFCKD